MVLYPLEDSSHDTRSDSPPRNLDRQSVATAISAWEAVERRQRQRASSWWLIAQPDHAALAGNLAAKISCAYIPKLDDAVVDAIALHDAGWAQFDAGLGGGNDLSAAHGSKSRAFQRPRSFLDVSPPEFLIAWNDSIQRAEESSAIGGILVSKHFSRLGETRLRAAGDSTEDTHKLRGFLAGESERQSRLAKQCSFSEQEISIWVDVLQLCDLLSLYLCCGSSEDVEFPQKFEGHSVALRRDGKMYKLEPAIFDTGVSLGVSARCYSPEPSFEPAVTTLPFLLT